MNWLSLGHISAVVQSVKTRKRRSYKANMAVGGPCLQIKEGGTGPREGRGEGSVDLFWGELYTILSQRECLKVTWVPFYQAACLSRGGYVLAHCLASIY